jgi:site-specific recombinase XerD
LKKPAMSKLPDEVRNTLRVHHYAMKTEKSYVQWIKRFILFHRKRHPAKMGKLGVEQFLTWLAVDRKVAPSTQNQALQAILFLYRKVLNIELAWLNDVVRAKRQQRVPVVLSRHEVTAVLVDIRNQIHRVRFKQCDWPISTNAPVAIPYVTVLPPTC